MSNLRNRSQAVLAVTLAVLATGPAALSQQDKKPAAAAPSAQSKPAAQLDQTQSSHKEGTSAAKGGGNNAPDHTAKLSEELAPEQKAALFEKIKQAKKRAIERMSKYYADPSHPDKLTGETFYWKARHCMDNGDSDKAIQFYTQSIKEFGTAQQKALYKSKDMYNYKVSWDFSGRAFCYCTKEKYQSAIDDLTQAIKLRPDYDVNYRNRSEAYKRIGKNDLSKRDLAIANGMKRDKLPDFLQKDLDARKHK